MPLHKDEDGYIHFTQATLIYTIIDDGDLTTSLRHNKVPVPSSTHLHAHASSLAFDEIWNYPSVVGKLNYLPQITRPDIMCATHMIANYSHDPHMEHDEAIIYLVMYLKSTKGIVLKFNPNRNVDFEAYADADFPVN